MSEEAGGDPPCWAHLFEGEYDRDPVDPLVVELGSSAVTSGGAVWSLPHGGDLDANLVRLEAGGGIGTHRNDELDVLLFVQSGAGNVTIDGVIHELGPDHLALVPRGAERAITAGADGLTYLSVHRRRGPLGISSRTTMGERSRVDPV